MAHFIISQRDDVLMFAHAMGFTYSLERVGFFERWRLKLLLRGQSLPVRKMPKFVSLDRIAEHYGCMKVPDFNSCKDESAYAFDEGKKVEVFNDYLGGLNKTRLKIVAEDKSKFVSENKKTSDVFIAEPSEFNLYYCYETHSLWTETQVVSVILWFSKQKKDYDDWRFFMENY